MRVQVVATRGEQRVPLVRDAATVGATVERLVSLGFDVVVRPARREGE